MRRPLIVFVIAWACAFTARTAAANDFQIQIRVQSENNEKRTERTEEAPSLSRAQPRPVVEVRRNAPVVLSWHAVNTGKTDTFEDVLVHFFVVEEKAIGQADVPKLSAGVVFERRPHHGLQAARQGGLAGVVQNPRGGQLPGARGNDRHGGQTRPRTLCRHGPPRAVTPRRLSAGSHDFFQDLDVDGLDEVVIKTGRS